MNRNLSRQFVLKLFKNPLFWLSVLSAFVLAFSFESDSLFGASHYREPLNLYLAFSPTEPGRHFFLPWIFSGVAHVSLTHLLVNIFFLFFAARYLSRLVNKKRVLMFYFASQLAVGLTLILAAQFFHSQQDLFLGMSAYLLFLFSFGLVARKHLFRFVVLTLALLYYYVSGFPEDPLAALAHMSGFFLGALVGRISFRSVRPNIA